MTGFIALPIKRDPADAEDTMDEVVRRQFPSWQAADGDPITFALRSVAVLYSEAAELATRWAEEGFRFYGRSIAQLPPTEDTPAIGVARFTAQDAAGPYVVPEGLEIAGRNDSGEPVGFRTVAPATIPNGSTTVDVAIEATEEGTAGNGIAGTAEFSEYVDYLTTVAFIGTTAGGEDREGDDPYLDRLREEFRVLGRPTLPHDFEVRARRLGAWRAAAIDGLNPDDDTTGNLATITLAMMDFDGGPLATRDAIVAAIEAEREEGWQVFGIDPTASPVDSDFTATAYPGWDPAVVEAAGIAALNAYLTGPRWGLRDDTGEDREWLNEPVVRYLEVAERLQRVEGLRYVNSLTIALAGDPPGTADLTLPGYAPVPSAGAITGSVS